jgi:hypothetical protein
MDGKPPTREAARNVVLALFGQVKKNIFFYSFIYTKNAVWKETTWRWLPKMKPLLSLRPLHTRVMKREEPYDGRLSRTVL